MVQPTTQASLSVRFKDWYSQIPFVTRWICFVNVGIFVLGLLIGVNYGIFCSLPVAVVYAYQVYRVFTAPWFHSGLLHIAFNMMALVPMGTSLERSIGSINFLYLNFLFMLVAGVADLAISSTLFYTKVYPNFFGECGVGYSGVLFGLIVVDTHHSTSPYRSIFGMFNVPNKLYPWALLILISLLAQSVSFIGHLCGMVAGYAYCYHLVDWALLPSSWATAVDMTWLGQRQGWITNSNYTGSRSASSSSACSCFAAPIQWIKSKFSRSSQPQQAAAFPASGGRTLGGNTYAAVPTGDVDGGPVHSPAGQAANV
mmetsp:Transcript_7152/g.11294  ORF Transcript_7152/g.11294 Transcript_7152/m.11294 type:complete len:313 (-) Transcript_7152:1467-2405(-)